MKSGQRETQTAKIHEMRETEAKERSHALSVCDGGVPMKDCSVATWCSLRLVSVCRRSVHPHNTRERLTNSNPSVYSPCLFPFGSFAFGWISRASHISCDGRKRHRNEP